MKVNLSALPMTDDSQFENEGSSELSVTLDEHQHALWFFMDGKPRPSFTPKLLIELKELFNDLANDNISDEPVEYLIAASARPGVYNLGGDLNTFRQYIQTGNAAKLREYAYACTDMGYECHRHFNKDITTIALIQGDALGGGFEAALSCNVIIVEEHAKIGFPEILFNLFPGMGAYTYISRRTNTTIADRMISTGRMYSARELYDLGVIDMVVPTGEGVSATVDFIKSHRKNRNGRMAMQKAKLQLNAISLYELHEIADIWVEAALKLTDKELKIMDRLVRAQSKRMLQSPHENKSIKIAS
jgi:DSF synthase